MYGQKGLCNFVQESHEEVVRHLQTMVTVNFATYPKKNKTKFDCLNLKSWGGVIQLIRSWIYFLKIINLSTTNFKIIKNLFNR
jgi:hypothetical protein